jgi:hypothetical protein
VLQAHLPVQPSRDPHRHVDHCCGLNVLCCADLLLLAAPQFGELPVDVASTQEVQETLMVELHALAKVRPVGQGTGVGGESEQKRRCMHSV